MKTINKTKFAISASIIAGLATGCASDINPFAQKELSSGYMNPVEPDAKKQKRVLLAVRANVVELWLHQ